MKNTRLLNQQINGFLSLAVVLFGFAQSIHAGSSWPLYAHDPQHSCLSDVASQTPQFIRWSVPVDLNPQ